MKIKEILKAFKKYGQYNTIIKTIFIDEYSLILNNGFIIMKYEDKEILKAIKKRSVFSLVSQNDEAIQDLKKILLIFSNNEKLDQELLNNKQETKKKTKI